ncbi:hypothetical protein BDV97DRAFT_423312 [Delphinella strobiligena]|nr:hypothetical protein BDV97DRAFT_423312 [Delphinella strobiligena]
MKWTEAIEIKLLLTILEGCDVNLDSEAVAKVMAAAGETCTPRAVEDRFRKLKRTKRENDEVEAAAGIMMSFKAPVRKDDDNDAEDSPHPPHGKVSAKDAVKPKSVFKSKVARKSKASRKS